MLRRGFILALCAVFSGCNRKRSPEEEVLPTPTRGEVWAAIQPRAKRYEIDPAFVYALIEAESGFSPTARNGDARGLFQLKPGAWSEVADTPYDPMVWNWRANLDAGIDYLAYLRSALLRKRHFTPAIWVAAFHYGLDHLETQDFDLNRIPPPDNEVFKALWRGERAPVPTP